MKFKEHRPFATPEAAEGKLLELANAVEPDHAGRLSVEIINRQFRDAGGSYEEYGAATTWSPTWSTTLWWRSPSKASRPSRNPHENPQCDWNVPAYKHPSDINRVDRQI
jgi:hypothetical protein